MQAAQASPKRGNEEEEFLLFLHPTGPTIVNLPLHVFFLGSLVYFDVFSGSVDHNDAFSHALISLCYLCIASSLGMSMFAVIPQLIGLGRWVSVVAQLKAAEIALCLSAIGILCAEFGATQTLIKKDCVDTNYLYEDNRKVYQDAYCNDRVHMLASSLLAIAVLKRSRFVVVAVASAVMSAALVFMLAFAPLSQHLEVTVGHILTGIALFSLISYFRFLLEQSERNHCHITSKLAESAAILAERREALEARVNEMLPPTIVERSSHRSSLLMKNDTSSEAVLWVMGVADFTVEASKVTQVDMATKLSRLQVGVTEYLQRSTSLQRVSVMLDELTAVGNLLSKSTLTPCVVSACSAGQHVVTELCGSLPLRVAIHVGEATGSFVGTRWIRYEVTGEAVTTARSALSFAAAGTVLVTDTALQAARDFLQVEEGPEMQLFNENDPDASAKHKNPSDKHVWTQLYVLHQCHASEDEEEAGLLHAQSSGSSVPLLAKETPLGDTAQSLFRYLQIDSRRNHIKSPNAAQPPPLAGHANFEMTSCWFMFYVFTDPSIEDKYTVTRQRVLGRRAATLWRAYAAFMVLSLLILIADLREPNGIFAVIVVSAAVAMATVVAIIPYLWPGNVDTWHTPWFLLTLASQLTFMYGLALSRPAAIGNDNRHLLIVGALLRGPVFKYARHQLIVTPLMFVAGVLQMLLPGGVFQTTMFAVLGVVLFTMFADAEVDLAQRHRFVTSRRIEETFILLAEEAKVREGLLRLTLPVPVKAWLDHLDRIGERLGSARWNTVADTIVVAATLMPPSQQPPIQLGSSRKVTAGGVGTTRHSWAVLEEAAAASHGLHIVSISGDTCLLLSPVSMVQYVSRTPAKDRERAAELLQFLVCVIENDSNFRLIVEIDDTSQVILTKSLPMFLPMGVGVTRTLAINTAADAALRGVIVTERVSQRFSACSTLRGSSYFEQPFPSWSIRGVGITRLIRLKKE